MRTLHPGRRRLRAALAATVLLLAASAAQALPYRPAKDSDIIETLPGRLSPGQRELRALRRQLAAQPENLALACALARLYIEQSRAEGDPRYLGYAEAALAPWWNAPAPPVAVRLLRATLRQSTHQFKAALEDLDRVLAQDRHNAQAWLTRATVLTVQGRFDEGAGSCARMAGLAPQLVQEACLANVDSLRGKLAASYARLRATLAASPDSDAGTRLWVSTLLAEMAVRLGEPAAERHFKDALALDRDDSYLLGAYADFLLDQRRAGEAMALLRERTRNDALLLRYALALQANGERDATAAARALADRFDAAMQRKDTVHQREQARYTLLIARQPAPALALARSNWEVQREPADLRIYAACAVAARDRSAAVAVLGWIKQQRVEDRSLSALLPQLAQLAGAPA